MFGQRAQITGDVFGVQHTANQVQRAGWQAGQGLGQGMSGGGVVPPIQPELRCVSEVHQRAVL